MTSSTGRPSNPPLALTSSRQISSAVPITLLGAAPAPVSARLNPTLMGSPLCADAPDGARSPMTNAATDARSAIPHIFPIVFLLAGDVCASLLMMQLPVWRFRSPHHFIAGQVRHADF